MVSGGSRLNVELFSIQGNPKRGFRNTNPTKRKREIVREYE